MSPELAQAIKERIELGHTKNQITTELRAAGYDDSTVEAVYDTAIQAPTVPSPTTTPGALIGYQALIAGSFGLIRTEWRLLLVSAVYGLGLLAAITGLIFAVFTVFGDAPAVALMLAVTVGIAGIIGLFALSFGFQRALLRRREQLSYLDHVRSVFPHIIGILLVTLYIQFATSLGYLLFIIPGIALAIYLTTAALIRINGQETGVMALVRSTQLVYGRWWGVLGRMLFTTLVFVLCTIPVFVLIAILWGATFFEAVAGLDTLGGAPMAADFMLSLTLIGSLIVAALAFVSFLMQCAMILLYESLRDTAAPLAPAKEARLYFWMRVIVIAGIPAMILLNVADFYLQDSDSTVEFESFLEDPTAFEQAWLADQAATEAELEAFMQEFQDEFQTIE